MELRLALVDKDQAYGRLCGKMMGRFKDPALHLVYFPSLAPCLDQAKDLGLDGVLLDQEIYMEEGDLLGIGLDHSQAGQVKIIILARQASLDLPKSFYSIYKYQKLDGLYKSILNLFADSIPIQDQAKDKGQGNFIFFEPVGGGVGATLLSQAFALRMAASRVPLGEGIFYFNREPTDFTFTSSRPPSQAGTYQGDMEDLALALYSQRCNLPMKVKALTMALAEGCHYIPQAKTKGPLTLLGREGLVKFLTFLGQTWTWTVLDFPFPPFPLDQAKTRPPDWEKLDLGQVYRVLICTNQLSSLSRAQDRVQGDQEAYQALLVREGAGEGARSQQAGQKILTQVKSLIPSFFLPYWPGDGGDPWTLEMDRARYLSRQEGIKDLEALVLARTKGRLSFHS